MSEMFVQPRRLGAMQCPECAKFARVIVPGHYAYPDGNWSYTVDCKKCGRVVSS